MKQYLLALITIIPGNVIQAQSSLEKTLLWEVTGLGISHPSYLYGTLHVLCANDLVVDEIIEQKFSATNQLFLEMDMDDLGAVSGAAHSLIMHDDIELKQLLSREEYDIVSENFMILTGLPVITIQKIKPMMAISFILPGVLGCAPEAWEQRLVNMATERSMQVRGLETIQQQIAVLDSIPLLIQAGMLANALKDIDSLKISFNSMLNLYKEKDIESLYKQTEAEKDFAAYEGPLIINRNNNWVSLIIEECKNMPTFYAFGAAHLAGENGIINLLRGKGYDVKPVMY